MSTIEEIEAAISKLPRDQFFSLHERLKTRFEEEWDWQIEKDLETGRLDHLAEEAVEEYRAGRTTPYPGE